MTAGIATTARLLSIDDAAAYLSCSPDTVRRLIDAGKVSVVRLPAIRERQGGKGADGSNRRLLVDRVELDALIPAWRERRAE
jgi:excisionase family DNA binding protein